MAEVVPSEELRSFLLRFYSVWEAQEYEAFREMISVSAHLVAIGSDPNEWWTGPDAVDIWIHPTREAGGVRIEPSRPMAYCAGNVGWLMDEALFTFANSAAVRMRVTAVVAIERGHWRIVQNRSFERRVEICRDRTLAPMSR